jgi:hypothetical protein
MDWCRPEITVFRVTAAEAATAPAEHVGVTHA